jgi:hypothetical protein
MFHDIQDIHTQYRRGHSETHPHFLQGWALELWALGGLSVDNDDHPHGQLSGNPPSTQVCSWGTLPTKYNNQFPRLFASPSLLLVNFVLAFLVYPSPTFPYPLHSKASPQYGTAWFGGRVCLTQTATTGAIGSRMKCDIVCSSELL